VLLSMPASLQNTLYESECKIPLPKYDHDGIFKSYL
jgi:hypothetical protein